MKQFNHLEIHKDNALLKQLVEKMKKIENDYFFYDKKASDNYNDNCKNITNDDVSYAIFRTDLESLYLTSVQVMVKDDELKVLNITSSDSRFFNLGVSRYNFVIDAFFHYVIERCIDESYTNCISISGEDRSLEKDLGSDVYNALKAWEVQCNKETPISHLTDEKAWFAFVAKLHKSRKFLHPSDLVQWLTEDCQWPSFYNDQMTEMAEKLEYSISLLNYYDGFNNI